MAAKRPLADCRLYAFVDCAYLRGRPLDSLARSLCRGGSDIVQLRAKGRSPEAIAGMAGEIAPITEEHGVHLVINDHLEVALEQPSPFVHLGQEDFFGQGRSRVGELAGEGARLSVGLSTHSPEQCARAVEAGADYVAVGPVHSTPTKPSARPVTTSLVRWAADHVSIPWFAIGGVRPESLDGILRAGARRVCVVSAILEAEDPEEACRDILRRLPSP